MASTDFSQLDDAEWEKAFRSHISGYVADGSNLSIHQTADRLRRLVRSGIVKNTDCYHRPERFLRAHNIMAELIADVGMGVFFRFTAHFNLFCVNVMAVGSPDQVALLDKYQEEGKIGCFALTERFAGVSSGLVVNTICNWDEEKQVFTLHTPDDGATKNWITAALVSDYSIVAADLRVGGKSYGPHAFVVELRKDGKDIKGLTTGHTAPTGQKSSSNDFENAWLHFDHVVLAKSTLLNRYADVVDNKYVQKQAGIRPLDMMASLYSGRVEFAHSSIIFARVLYENCRRYTDSKACWAPKNARMMLSDVPQLAVLLPVAEQQLRRAEAFMQQVEAELCACLRLGELPKPDLFQRIVVGKVYCVELALALCLRLKEEVGAFAILPGCGFEHMDHLYAARFVEGDSRILKQKLARDQVKAFQKGAKVSPKQEQLCKELLNGASALTSFELAETVCEDVIEQTLHVSKL